METVYDLTYFIVGSNNPKYKIQTHTLYVIQISVFKVIGNRCVLVGKFLTSLLGLFVPKMT